MSRPRPPPPDPRLLELLPDITRRAVARSRRRRHPVDDDEVRSIVAYTLFRYFRRYPEGTADDHRRRAYMRCCNAVVDTVRIMGVRRAPTLRGPSTGARFGYDPQEMDQAVEEGWLPRAVVIRLAGSTEEQAEAIDPQPFPDEQLHERREEAARQRLIDLAPDCNPRTREVLHSVLKGEKHLSIAARLGVSEPRISQLLHKAAGKVRWHYQGCPAEANRPSRRRLPNPPSSNPPPDTSAP